MNKDYELIEEQGQSYLCVRCGVVVLDHEKHDAFHEQVSYFGPLEVEPEEAT